MAPTWTDGPVTVHLGHVLDVLRRMPDGSVHVVCSSPPYWGLRDYKVEPVAWGGDPDHSHEWLGEIASRETTYEGKVRWQHVHNGRGELQKNLQDRECWTREATGHGRFCACGAWLGCLGLEPTPDLYVEHVVEVFREVKRVLRRDGTCWVNLGDSYAGSWGPQSRSNVTGEGRIRLEGSSPLNARRITAGIHPDFGAGAGSVKRTPGLKPKDLCMIPARVALALQADGWWLRSQIVWAKTNPMPESAADRPTTAHEFVYLLSKSATYHYDAEAIREPSTDLGRYVKTPDGWDTGPGSHGSFHRNGRERGRRVEKQQGLSRRHIGFNERWDSTSRAEQMAGGRNVRNVWTIATQPYPEAHFATFPEEIPRRAILAGTSEVGCCPECGAPWRRIVDQQRLRDGRHPVSGSFFRPDEPFRITASGVGHWRFSTRAITMGWEPGCQHGAEPVACQVLDPFVGSGTTLAVARRLGRFSTGIELQPAYLPLIQERVRKAALPLLEADMDDDPGPVAEQAELFEGTG